MRSFNSRTREGCDRRLISQPTDVVSFNSRTREGCDKDSFEELAGLLKFQFTHPGGVRLFHTKLTAQGVVVSIHAPGRGATGIVVILEVVCVFQFTHPGGVRLEANARAKCFYSGFNSRTREGCDAQPLNTAAFVRMFQFTHPGGVRPKTRAGRRRSGRFNSRTREGCDVSAAL